MKFYYDLMSCLVFQIWNRLEECLELLCKSNRLPEAAFLARTYLPSQVPRIVKLWKEDLAKTNKKAADSLADPTQYSNLFPDIQEAIRAETVVDHVYCLYIHSNFESIELKVCLIGSNNVRPTIFLRETKLFDTHKSLSLFSDETFCLA